MQLILVLQKQLKAIRGPRILELIRMQLQTELQVISSNILSISGT